MKIIEHKKNFFLSLKYITKSRNNNILISLFIYNLILLQPYYSFSQNYKLTLSKISTINKHNAKKTNTAELKKIKILKEYLIPFFVVFLFLIIIIFMHMYKMLIKKKQAEESHKKSEEKLLSFIDAAPLGIVVINSSGRIELVNNTIENMYGYTKDELFGKTVEIFVPELMHNYPHKNLSYKGTNLSAKRKDNTEFPVEIVFKAIKSKPRTLIVGFITDITEREESNNIKKMLENELIQSEQSSTLGKLAAGIAHEINNPVSAVNCDINSMKKIIEKLPQSDEKTKLIEIINRDTEAILRVGNIVTAVKSTYRPEQWRLIDINKEIDLQLTLLHKEFKKRIEIIKKYSTLPMIKAYGSEIGQAILNLLTNAFDSIEKEGTVTIKTDEIGDSVSIDITDTGTGIEPKIRPYIFNSFFSTKGSEKGTGLGLAISHQIAKRHKGRMYLSETSVGKGSTFILEISKEAVK